MKLNTKPLQDIEIGMMVLEDKQTLFARIGKAVVKPAKDKPGNTLHVPLLVVDNEVMKRGHGENAAEMVPNPGNLNFTFYVGMTPSDNYDPNKKLKEIAIAIKKEDTENLDLDDIVEGTYIKIVTKFEPKKGQYPDRNSVVGLRPITDEDNFDPSNVAF